MSRFKLSPSHGSDYRPTAADIHRFMRMVQVDPDTGAWLWQGHVNEKGYGQFRLGSRMWWAHRVSYLIFNGPLLDGMHVHHLPGPDGGDPLSGDVNPDRLVQTTPAANVAEGNRRRARLRVEASVMTPEEEPPF